MNLDDKRKKLMDKAWADSTHTYTAPSGCEYTLEEMAGVDAVAYKGLADAQTADPKQTKGLMKSLIEQMVADPVISDSTENGAVPYDRIPPSDRDFLFDKCAELMKEMEKKLKSMKAFRPDSLGEGNRDDGSKEPDPTK